MFENLSNRLSRTLLKISDRGRLSEENIRDTLQELRITLLESDVALSVIQDFINRVKKSALGQEINKNLTPGQAFIKIVRAELVSAMGAKNDTLNLAVQPPAVLLIVGLQGAGKTTTVSKLAKYLREKKKKKVLVVSVDVYRPAAIDQLEILAKTVGVDFFASNSTQNPLNIASQALEHAKKKFYDVLLVDTAGRLHVDKAMITEIINIHTTIKPVETLFVVDAMTGQDAANIAKRFHQILSLTGFILTKVDSDARGGAALSLHHITGKSIKFMGIGEKADALELFDPTRLADRILGMGDVFSLIEDFENKIDQAQAEKLARKLKKGSDFDLTDFLEQLKQMRRMGGMAHIVSKLPGHNQLLNNVKSQVNDKILLQMEAIINSMTIQERINPNIIKNTRKRRIAVGSGVQVQDVNRLLNQFGNMQYIMQKMKKGGMKKKIMHNIKDMMLLKFLNH